ncbi:hypothetical protein JOB18_021822 [Solea senegalensis]|uniref:Uncharacterized protein n=1 Tax=Solea senegalensis TaxID=28829 RepID=A0AAV6RHU7_SOLSE|nr:hypothetical protein JOB18_021822 [Solea senegalensis]KAG7505042.1 hypothetical protein JOB18_021822 [Solea senegalensis]
MCRYRRGVALLLTHTQRLSPVLRIAAAPNSVNMASALGRLARLSVLRRGRASPLTRSDGQGMAVTSRRTAVCTSSGAILPKPRKVSVETSSCDQTQSRDREGVVFHYKSSLHKLLLSMN